MWLAPGRYRVGGLTLRPGSQIVGVRGATHLVFTHGPSLIAADHAETVSLSGLVLDGAGQSLPQRRGLVHLTDVRGLRLTDCTVLRASGDGITLLQCDGSVTGNTITDAADNGLFSNDSRGLVITGNIIRGCGNGGIRVWQSEKRHDGSLIADNTIEDTKARAGGSGQNGNAINVYRAADVIVRGNHIDKAAFSAIRGNGAANIQIVGNNCRNLGEVALYAEFDFQGAVIASNTVQRAEIGVVTTNFNDGGRLAVVQGNLIRDMTATAPQGSSAGIGIARRGRCRRDRQRGRERAGRGHQCRRRQISARRHRHRQRGAQERHRHRCLGVSGRGRRGDRQQYDRGRPARRHRRHGMAKGRDRRSGANRRQTLSADQDQRQPSELKG